MEAERAKVARDAATNAVAELSKKNAQLEQQCELLQKGLEHLEKENKTLKDTMTERLDRVEKSILGEQRKYKMGKRGRIEVEVSDSEIDDPDYDPSTESNSSMSESEDGDITLRQASTPARRESDTAAAAIISQLQ